MSWKTKMVALLAVVVMALLLAAFGLYCRLSMRSTEATRKFRGSTGGKVAIIYYSQSGEHNTETVAKWIKKHARGDLIVIEPLNPYPDSYSDTLEDADAERISGKFRPIKPLPSLTDYDVIFIGSPIWYGTCANPVAEFLKTNKLAGKKVLPFCTHGGGGPGNFEKDIRGACPDAEVHSALVMRGSNRLERLLGIGVSARHTEDDVVDWLNYHFPEVHRPR